MLDALPLYDRGIPSQVLEQAVQLFLIHYDAFLQSKSQEFLLSNLTSVPILIAFGLLPPLVDDLMHVAEICILELERLLSLFEVLI